MTGKPVYKPEEIRFALELMVQDLFNEEISSSFRERFNRELTDNQIRYLRNKYGKDPDYGSPLINRPASKKLKRRRAAFAAASSASPPSEDSPPPMKRTCRESSSAAAGPSQPQQTQSDHLPPHSPTKLEDQLSPTMSSVPPYRASALQPQVSNLRSPPGNSCNPTLGPPTQGGYATESLANPWQAQQRRASTTNFTPINTRVGQYGAISPEYGNPEAGTVAPYQSLHQPPNAQTSCGSSSFQQPTADSNTNLRELSATGRSSSFTGDMPTSNATQLSDFVYPQQLSSEGYNSGTKQEADMSGGDLSLLNWGQYIKPVRQATEETPFQSFPTRDTEDSEHKLQGVQEKSAASESTVDGEKYEQVAQVLSHASTAQQDWNANNDMGTIDPRLFDIK
ncbi:hypothetical protein F53441_10078 [Fusarium austroafricanum]|uniref:Uncharacterized protein n=1 Tax=Fusarium austroafricanum TaxID=2364996 RepID=A0A8H4KAC5_9HYPO|nr:hypothetical protein F53441_10078 [Fusarium austroafricanum]